MKTVYNWNAVRSGASITVYGCDNLGKEIKLSGIKSIGPVEQRVVAKHEDGSVHFLAGGQHAFNGGA